MMLPPGRISPFRCDAGGADPQSGNARADAGREHHRKASSQPGISMLSPATSSVPDSCWGTGVRHDLWHYTKPYTSVGRRTGHNEMIRSKSAPVSDGTHEWVAADPLRMMKIQAMINRIIGKDGRGGDARLPRLGHPLGTIPRRGLESLTSGVPISVSGRWLRRGA